MKTLILTFLMMIMIFTGCNENQPVTNNHVSQINSTQLPSISATKQMIGKQSNANAINLNDMDSIKSAPIDLKFAYYTANSNTANGLLRWYISATSGSLNGYIFSLGDIETINGTEKVSWREVSNNAASVNLTSEKVVIGDIADNTNHTFMDWGLGVEKNYESIQEDIELIRNSTVNVRWWFFQAPNSEWYIIDKANHIYKFKTNNGEYDWQVVDTTGETIEFYMEGGVKKVRIIQIATLDPGINISLVRGNTADYNSIAEFDVKLTAKPLANVTIPLSSSDENEGILTQTSLTFTPQNWDIPQIVEIKGQNQNVINNIQNYQIILSPAESTDNGYNGFDADDVEMKGIILELSIPTDSLNFISLLSSTITQNINYTGNKELSFSLVEKPDGMSIELNTGLITWIPSNSTEGNSYSVKVRVTDGVLFSEINFSVNVANSLPIPIQTEGNTVSVIDVNSNLNGLKITVVDENTNPNEIKLDKVDANTIENIPPFITRISDFFVVKDKVTGTILIQLPLSYLPIGSDLNYISLYSFVEAYGIEEKFWSPVSTNTEISKISGVDTITITLSGIEGLFFIGVETPQSSNSSSENSSSNKFEKTTISNVSCIPKQRSNGSLNYMAQTCTVNGNNNVHIKVEGFGTLSSSTRWNGTKIQNLITWLMDAQEGFDKLHLGYDNNFTVKIHSMPKPSYLGYVTTGNNENRKTLHLTSVEKPKNIIKGTSVHEYFHHAQSRSRINNKDLLINGGIEKNWFIEGTARWFEDYLFDSLNTYSIKEGKRGYRILEAGIHGKGKRGIYRPYQRFSFFKLLSEKCTNFDNVFKKFLNINKTVDNSGILNLQAELTNAQCNFGNHLGELKKSSLDSALVYYQYATLYKNQIQLLDSNETNVIFNFQKTPHQFSRPWLDSIADWLNLDDNIEYKLQAKESIPPAGAFSFFTKEVQGNLPDGKIAVLKFESDKDIIISIVSPTESFINGENTIDAGNGNSDKHKWFKYSTSSNFVYEFSGKVPKLFVSLVNPSTTDTATNIKVTFEITDEVNHELTVTSHANGDEVNHRVITLQGKVPDEIKGLVDTIKVTNSGATTISTVNSNGTFSLGVVVTMGANIIKLQAFDGTTALTQTKLLNLTGVANGSNTQNALIPSRIAVVLQWKTNRTDIDLYSTDKNNGTIWYSNKIVSPGSLDYDNTRGYGPEVISYRKTDDNVYVDGIFDIDVHFYSGSTTTAYSLDVIMNETDPSNLRMRHYESKVSLSHGASSQRGPNGRGSSRFNDLIKVRCNTQRICSISNVATSKLSNVTTSTENDSIANNSIGNNTLSTNQKDKTSYDKCIKEYNQSLAKSGHLNWSCEEETGKKIWE